MTTRRKYWLMKSEPDVFSIDDLEKMGTTHWEGVRNYQARNFMRDQMNIGDQVLFYHSRCKPPCIAGIGEICRKAYPDFTAWDPKSTYYDRRSTKENPVWMMVDVQFVEKLKEPISLPILRSDSALNGLLVIKKGQRLSILPVTAAHFQHILKMAKAKSCC